MVCPFRVGVRFDHLYVGDSDEDRHNPDKYIEVAQHAMFESCVEYECPYYISTLGCQRVNEGGD